MNIAAEILKAPHMGIRDIKEHISKQLLKKMLVITDRGVPVSVNLPYSDVLELTDIVDELTDLETITIVQEGRRAIHEGAKGLPVGQLFKRVREKHK